jgi:virginiamycin B lyase
MRGMKHAVVFAFSAMVACSAAASIAAGQTSQVLSGSVTSAEGSMEGVLVTARMETSTISHTVATDANGRYRFSSSQLAAGRYALSAVATGYDMATPVSAVIGTRSATANIALKKTDDLAAQLSNAEWLASWPGTDAEKLLTIDCMSCHSLERIARSTHDVEGFIQLIPRMLQYANNSTIARPQLRPGKPINVLLQQPERVKRLATYLASVNLNGRDRWSYALKPFPRKTGKETQAVVTSFALENKGYEPHDVMVDKDGSVYYSQFADQSIGRLDPKTGKSVQYALPTPKPQAPKGTLDLQRDPDGNYWVATMFQGGIARLDKTTKTVQAFLVPKEMDTVNTQVAMLAPQNSHVDGKIWFADGGSRMIGRLHVQTGKFEFFRPFQNIGPDSPLYGRVHSFYQIFSDSRNELYFLDFADHFIVHLEPKSAQFAYYPTPTDFSRPRRGMMDAQDRLWFAEYAAGQIGMFDTRSKQMKEWKVPTPWFLPYQAVIDKNGHAWTAGMSAREIVRIDTRTGETFAFPLPEMANIRNIHVDDTTSPVSVWVGNNHGASILRLQAPN